MMLSPSYFIFLPTLILGSFLTVSSTSWLAAWIGLELNLLSFIPLICSSSSPYLSESALKYFLIQAISSTIIVMSSSLQFLSSSVYPFMLVLSLIMKLGAAPFHFWLPQIIDGLSWHQVFIMLTIQKLAPMYMVSYLLFNESLIFIILASSSLSALLGALGGLNSMKLRKIIAYSSINHLSWMLLGILINETIFLLYFTFYIMISLSVIFLFALLRAYHMNDLLNFSPMNSFHSFLVPLSLLSLGGLPPFSGFFPKWIMIEMLMQAKMYFLLSVLLFSALVTLFFYIRVSIPMMLMMSPSLSSNIKFFKYNYKSFFVYSSFFFNIFMFVIPATFFSL